LRARGYLPRDWRNQRLTFSVHGGQARVMLLEGGDLIPTSGSMSTILTDMLNGRYGRVVESVNCLNSNDQHIAVDLAAREVSQQ
jgi:hypothetical protein